MTPKSSLPRSPNISKFTSPCSFPERKKNSKLSIIPSRSSLIPEEPEISLLKIIFFFRPCLTLACVCIKKIRNHTQYLKVLRPFVPLLIFAASLSQNLRAINILYDTVKVYKFTLIKIKSNFPIQGVSN